MSFMPIPERLHGGDRPPTEQLKWSETRKRHMCRDRVIHTGLLAEAGGRLEAQNAQHQGSGGSRALANCVNLKTSLPLVLSF